MKKHTIYVDLGYKDSTRITVVENSTQDHNAHFRNLRPELNWEDASEEIIAICKELKVTSDQVYVPFHPAMEAIIRRHLPGPIEKKRKSIIKF